MELLLPVTQVADLSGFAHSSKNVRNHIAVETVAEEQRHAQVIEFTRTSEMGRKRVSSVVWQFTTFISTLTANIHFLKQFKKNDFYHDGGKVLQFL